MPQRAGVTVILADRGDDFHCQVLHPSQYQPVILSARQTGCIWRWIGVLTFEEYFRNLWPGVRRLGEACVTGQGGRLVQGLEQRHAWRFLNVSC